MGRPPSGHRRWAGHSLMVARDSAVKLLTVIYDVHPLPFSLWVHKVAAAVACYGKLPRGTSTYNLNMQWIPAPGTTFFLVSGRMVQKRYRTTNPSSHPGGFLPLTVPLYPRYTPYFLLRLTTVRAARHAGNKADSISTFKGTLNFEAGVGAAHFTD